LAHSTEILGSISPALSLPWILDIDVTVKPLYGHQEAAQIGYNPKKTGRAWEHGERFPTIFST
jgi:hypothetical protein